MILPIFVQNVYEMYRKNIIHISEIPDTRSRVYNKSLRLSGTTLVCHMYWKHKVFWVPGDGDCFFRSISHSVYDDFIQTRQLRQAICSLVENN